MSIRMSPTLEIAAGDSGPVVHCSGCGHALGAAGAPWKQAAELVETQINKLPQATYSTSDDVVLRRFHCPGCGRLLDAETAVRGDPFLGDVLFVGALE